MASSGTAGWSVITLLALAGCQGRIGEPVGRIGAGPQEPDAPDCDVPDVGATPLRRLTREQYDNTVRDDREVDATGVLVATDVDGPFDGAIELGQRLAGSPMVEECLTREWFRFALGRYETDADECAVQEIATAFEQPDQLRALLVAIATSEAFRSRRLP